MAYWVSEKCTVFNIGCKDVYRFPVGAVRKDPNYNYVYDVYPLFEPNVVASINLDRLKRLAEQSECTGCMSEDDARKHIESCIRDIDANLRLYMEPLRQCLSQIAERITLMLNNSQCYCRICGLLCDTNQWGNEEELPSYDICDCCGVEFGYEDYTLDSIRKYRNNWLKNGAKWFNPKAKPDNWSLREQMNNIPVEYR